MPFIFLQPTQFNNAHSIATSFTAAGEPLHAILCLMGNYTILVTTGCSMRAYRYNCVCDWVNEVYIWYSTNFSVIIIIRYTPFPH